MDAEIDPANFRHVLGHLPTGVTIITAQGPQGPVGMACNSFTSVSLTPPLASFCAGLTSTTWPSIRESGRFCVNILGDNHEDVCRMFARRGVDRFAHGGWDERPGGPGLRDAVAWIDCEIAALHEAGDHELVIGRVMAIDTGDPEATPLVFHRGAYGSFLPSDAGRSA